MAAGTCEDLAALRARAYHLAARILDSSDEAEDAVQEAYLKALRHPPRGAPAAELRVWFLSVVANAAKDLRRRAAARRRKEAAMKPVPADAAPQADGEIRVALQGAVSALEEKYRVPICLCCEQDLSRREAAAVLRMPESTLTKYVNVGFEKLRRALARAGYAAAPAAVLAGLKATAPAVPASLGAAVEKLVAGQAAVQAGGATSLTGGAAAAAKGGIAMKVVAGVIAAGTLAGAVAVSTGAVGGRSASVGEGEPAPVNPYNGMQEREEVFEFTQKPSVRKEGGKWVITFASKGACDATVAILDKDGKIIRHLASGVLGKNAPYPFQQNSLSQKIEWDGLTDDFKKAPAGCKVKVLLGLKAEYELSALYDPYYHRLFDRLSGSPDQTKEITGKVLVAKGKDGTVYVVTKLANAQGRVYDKDGKYLRTFFPPPAAEAEKLMGGQGHKFATTKWGDKTIIANWFGPFGGSSKRDTRKKPVFEQFADPIAALKAQPGVDEIKIAPLPSFPKSDVHCYQVRRRQKMVPVSLVTLFGGKGCRMAADRERETVYFAGFRLDGKTGKVDKTWFPNREMSGVTECAVGPDGLVYFALGSLGYGNWIARFDRDGKLVGFTGDGAVSIPAGGNMWGSEKEVYGPLAGTKKGWWRPRALQGDGKILFTGVTGHSNTHERGLYVSPNGTIVMGLLFQGAPSGWAVKHGIPKEHKGNQQSFVAVWDKDGNYITANALGDTHNGHGVFMDRDRNIYATVFGTLGKKGKPDGITTELKIGRGTWGSFAGLVKFRWGGKFPLASLDPKSGKGVETQKSAQWTYNGIPSQSYGSCTCHNVRCDMDYWARTWVPANHLYSVMVIDSNGNRIARLGRYGNVDDSEKDLKEKRGDGLRFAWMRALCVSDTALYVWDQANLRILKAKLGYHAEETVGLDGSSVSAPPARESSASASSPAPGPPVAVAKQDSPAPAPAPVAAVASAADSGPDPAVVCRGWWSLAMSYKRAGRKGKAREYLRKIIAQHPDTDHAARARRELAQL